MRSNEVEGSTAASGPAGAGLRADSEEPVTRAEQLFASLTEQAEQRRQNARFPPAPPPAALPAAEPEDPPPTEPPPLTNREVRDYLLSARAASERTAMVVKVVRSHLSATNADLAVLGEAMEQALDAINDRLAALELDLLGETGPAALPAEKAMARLRRVVRQTSAEDRSRRLM